MTKYIKYFFHKLNKKITVGLKISAGRNYLGTICVNHKFGGNKSKYFSIDFFRRINTYGYIYRIIKYNNRTAHLGNIIYDNGLFTYIIISENIILGQKVYSGIFNIQNKIGYTSLLKNVKLFSLINNIELYPKKGASLTRAAGTSVLLTSNVNKKVIIKLKSG
jgi:large subunit ribosomal protein L2